MEIITQALQSATVSNYGNVSAHLLHVAHYTLIYNIGYVLDCLPSMCEEWKTIVQQIDFIEKLKPAVTVIINLRVS